METPENKSSNPHQLWLMLNDSLVAIFQNLPLAADSLHRFSSSIVNAKQYFAELLIPSSSATPELKSHYLAFNKWLLGRLFYILSQDSLERIHNISINAQKKILSILSTNNSPFYDEICNEYLECNEKLIKFYDNIENEATENQDICLELFTPSIVNVPGTKIDLTPIFATVSTKSTCKALIIYMTDILCEIAVPTIDAQQNVFINNVLLQQLFVLKNFDFDFKVIIINNFTKIINHHGLMIRFDFIKKYLLLVENLILNIPTFINDGILFHYKQVEKLNFSLAEALTTFNLLIDALDETYKDIIFNICTFVLNLNEIHPENSNKSSLSTYKFEFSNNAFSTNLQKACFELLNLHFYTKEFFAGDSPCIEYLITNMPAFYTSSIVSQLTNHLYSDRAFSFDENINMIEHSSIVKKLISSMITNLQSARCRNIDVLIINAHLRTCVNILDIIQDSIIELQSRYQQYNKTFHNIFNFETKNCRKLKTYLTDTDICFECVPPDNVKSIIENVKQLLNELYMKKTNTITEISLCIEICMKTLILSKTVYCENLFTIIQMESFLRDDCNDNAKFNVYPQKFHTEIHAYSLKVFVTQTFILNGILETQAMNNHISQILDNLKISTNMLLLFPLLVISEVIPLQKCIGNYLLPASYSKEKSHLDMLMTVLPVITCILYGHYVIFQSKHDNYVDDIGFQLSSIDGIHLNFLCLHCYNSHDCSNVRRTIQNKLKDNRVTIVMKRSRFTFIENKSKASELKKLFHKLSANEFYKNVSNEKLYQFILTTSQHSTMLPCIENILVEKNLPLMKDSQSDDRSKNSILNIFMKLLLIEIKTSLETGNIGHQDTCLQIIREFGMSKSEVVILPSLKFLMFYLMHMNSSLHSNAASCLKDVCEAHDQSPDFVYHKYKKEICQIMMELTSFNYIMGQQFVPSIIKVIRAFKFSGHRDFISKEIHHVLPYLIPIIIESETLKMMIPEISALIPCTSSDLLRERFPHIYTHLYLYVPDSNASRCYKYIQEITSCSLANLIKMHSRVILTELLLQYCCKPEKVIEACKSLTNLESGSPSNDSSTIPLTQVADYIQPKMLGVLAYIDTKLIHVKVALSVKRIALQSFPNILNLMGPKHITPLRFKILATLQTALSVMKEFPLLNVEAWNAFVRNIDTISLGSLLKTIVVSLLPLTLQAPDKVNKIFEYLIVQNENILSTSIADLFFLDEIDIPEYIKVIVRNHLVRNRPRSFISQVQWYMQYLNQDMPEIKVYALKHLHELMKDNRQELDLLFHREKNINSIIVNLLEILISGCKSKDENLTEWSSRCIGQIGALQPSLLPCKPATLQNESQFAFSIMDMCFIKAALTELIKAFQFETHTKNMDSFSLAIQEILNTCNIKPVGENKKVWESFPENAHQIMFPLLSSRYTLAYPMTPLSISPIFGSSYATTFSEWGQSWAGQLISNIERSKISDLLQIVHPALKKDLQTLILFLPYIVLHTVLTIDNMNIVKGEIMSVIGLTSFDSRSNTIDSMKIRHLSLKPSVGPIDVEKGTHIKCCKMIYSIFDFLNRWVMEWSYDSTKSQDNTEFLKVKKFLGEFCKLTIARGNYLSGELERALQYLEVYMKESPENFQEQLSFLAEIYAVLNEPDALACIMSMKQNEPSLSELILTHEVTGQLQDAAACYEKYAQQGNMDSDKLRGMVEVYLKLDQPFTALRILQDTDEFEGETLAAEPFWRLGMFDELDKLLHHPDKINNNSWGVNVGHCLLALRSGVRESVEEKLKLARNALLRSLNRSTGYASTEESIYSRIYPTVLCLHVLSEFEDIENVIFKIGELDSDSDECSLIINQLIDEWNLRFKLLQSSTNTVEPILRMRRILLEQAKELLEDKYEANIPSLDKHIGELWLQSAKFARKAGNYQQAYIYILNSEKYAPKELFIQKAKLHWLRGEQKPAFCTLKRGLVKHINITSTPNKFDKKISAKAKLLIAIYNDKTINVDMDVNIVHYKNAVSVFGEWEKSLVCLGEYYEKMYSAMTNDEKKGGGGCAALAQALDCYGRSLQYGHKKLYQSMPRMLTIWLDFEISQSNSNISKSTLAQMCAVIEGFTEQLPLYLFLSAFSQITSRICHPQEEVYRQLRSIIVKVILAYPQHALWMMMCVIKSGYPQRIKRCQKILYDPRLKEPAVEKFIRDFTTFAEHLIELCNKPLLKNSSTANVSSIVKNLPILLNRTEFSQIIMPHEQFVKLSLPYATAKMENDYNPFPSLVYVSGIEQQITILPSLQKPRKVTLKGSDGKRYIIMLKPKDDLRKDFRLMEFNAVVNRYLQENPDARERRLHIRTYTVLPLNEECGIIEWIPNLLGLRPILLNIYRKRNMITTASNLKQFMCKKEEPLSKKKTIFENQLLPRHPAVFAEWFRYTFPDPHSWFQARTAYTRTTAVISMVGYILGLGDRHGENVLLDSTNGDTVHVDFNCLFNKGEEFEYPEIVPFRLTHNMQSAMGPLAHEGPFRKCCEITMRVLRAQAPTLMSVIRPFVYDPLVTWQKQTGQNNIVAERINEYAKDCLMHIENRLQGMVYAQGKQFTLSLSTEGQVNHLILEAISVVNLCQMYIGWAAFL